MEARRTPYFIDSANGDDLQLTADRVLLFRFSGAPCSRVKGILPAPPISHFRLAGDLHDCAKATRMLERFTGGARILLTHRRGCDPIVPILRIGL